MSLRRGKGDGGAEAAAARRDLGCTFERDLGEISARSRRDLGEISAPLSARALVDDRRGDALLGQHACVMGTPRWGEMGRYGEVWGDMGRYGADTGEIAMRTPRPQVAAGREDGLAAGHQSTAGM